MSNKDALIRETQSKKDKQINVCFYIRVSTDKQAKKNAGSLDTQLDRLKSFVNYKKTCGENWVTVKPLIEGEEKGQRHGRSAKETKKREKIQELRQLAQAGLIDVVIITDISRLARNTVDFLLLADELDKNNVKIVSLKENIDLTSPTGKLITTFIAALAQYERETIAARTKDKVKWRAEQGLPIGPPPIGYIMKDKKYVIEGKYAKHIKACDNLYLDRQSGDVVVQEFYNRGYRTPSNKIYNKPMICRILRNPTYVAKIEYEGKIFDAQWEPIRSWDTHQKIQKIMDRNTRHRHSPQRQSQEHVYLLQGLLRCSVCEHMMTPKPGTGRSGKYYPYYACSNAEKAAGLSCPRNYLPADTSDQAVLKYLKGLEFKPEVTAAFIKRANELTSETVIKLKEDLKRVQDQLAIVRGKLSNIVESIATGGKTVMLTLHKKLEDLESEKEELESTETRLKAEIEAEHGEELSIQDQIRTLSLFNQLVSLNENTPERIKVILPSFIDYVVWHNQGDGTGHLEVALFPRPIAKATDTTFQVILKELVNNVSTKGKAKVTKPPKEIGRTAWQEESLVRPRVSIGVSDGDRTRNLQSHSLML